MNAVDNTEVEVRLIPLAAIIIDPAVQQQAAGTSQAVVAEYAEAMRDGVKFPPIDVFRNEDGTIHLADGFHRADAHRSAHPEVQSPRQSRRCAPVRLPRQRAARTAAPALGQGEGCYDAPGQRAMVGVEDREIARQCGVSHRFVSLVRRDHVETFPDAGQPQEATAADTCPAPDQSATNTPAVASPHRRRTVKRRGKRYSMDTVRIGRGRSQPSRRKKADLPPTLDPRAWSESTPPEREAFVKTVGRSAIEGALNSIESGCKLTPGLNALHQSWKAASPPERVAFASEYHDVINTLGWWKKW
jgi:hypothetical protein